MRAARAMAMGMRVAGDEGGNGNGGKSDGNGDKGGRQAMVTMMATKRVMVTATRVGGKQQQLQ